MFIHTRKWRLPSTWPPEQDTVRLLSFCCRTQRKWTPRLRYEPCSHVNTLCICTAYLCVLLPFNKLQEFYKALFLFLTQIAPSLLVSRMTRHPYTVRPAWATRSSSSCSLSTRPTPTRPPPQATRPYTSLRARDTSTPFASCWMLGHSRPR